jgi:hypothetical protein
MKKDRNCGMGIPVYPVMPGMAMPMPMGSPMMGNMPNYNMSNSTLENQIQNLNNQINSLEQRVNSLETLVNQSVYSNNYNTSNYQMM